MNTADAPHMPAPPIRSPARPEILAPAGNKAAFLAAIAAGADAVYAGCKTFSARMEAKNFSVAELAALTDLAHRQGVRVYVTLNTLLRPGEMTDAGHLIQDLTHQVAPDALIVQDPGMVGLARDAGFEGALHLSTLANISFPEGLRTAARLPGVTRVVVPRELDIDEIKIMASQCPETIRLETFVHGALCYGVSGRCYWSSYMGGRSGLRGRCVQPCRRRYRQGSGAGRSFACQDFGLDVLVRVLADIPEISAWKIEGRKKGAHYVYYTVSAYQMLRDEGSDPQSKKAAMGLLDMALGRGRTHYRFLPQRPFHPVSTERESGSGLRIGTIKGPAGRPFLSPATALLKGDMVRIGYEDDSHHQRLRLRQAIPRNGRYQIRPERGRRPPNGTPVFLTDRQEPALTRQIDALATELNEPPPASASRPSLNLALPSRRGRSRVRVVEYTVSRRPSRDRGNPNGVWVDPGAPTGGRQRLSKHAWWWLPPVIWPSEQAEWFSALQHLQNAGARQFVLNAPWQMTLLDPERAVCWAGPFCNVANPMAIRILADLGFKGVVASPELPEADMVALPGQSVLPMGVVVGGMWPLCLSRVPGQGIQSETPVISPKGEGAWTREIGLNTWVFPDWSLDLSDHAQTLVQAGYRHLIHLKEVLPKGLRLKPRPGQWNWRLDLK